MNCPSGQRFSSLSRPHLAILSTEVWNSTRAPEPPLGGHCAFSFVRTSVYPVRHRHVGFPVRCNGPATIKDSAGQHPLTFKTELIALASNATNQLSYEEILILQIKTPEQRFANFRAYNVLNCCIAWCYKCYCAAVSCWLASTKVPVTTQLQPSYNRYENVEHYDQPEQTVFLKLRWVDCLLNSQSSVGPGQNLRQSLLVKSLCFISNLFTTNFQVFFYLAWNYYSQIRK